MVKEFDLTHGVFSCSRGVSGDTYHLLRADANIFITEFYYIEKYISQKLKQNSYLKDFSKSLNKEEKITRLTFGVNFKEENIEYFPEARSVVLETNFDYNEIKKIKDTNQRADKLLNVISTNANKYEFKVQGITQILENIIIDFKKDNYKNTWEYQKRRIKGIGTTKLTCELTPFRFYLRLVVENKNKEIIYNQIILETLPDSICYHSKFKSLIVTDSEIIVTDRIYDNTNKNTLYKISLKDLILNKTENRETATNRFARFPPMPSWIIDFEKYTNSEITEEEHNKRQLNFTKKHST